MTMAEKIIVKVV